MVAAPRIALEKEEESMMKAERNLYLLNSFYYNNYIVQNVAQSLLRQRAISHTLPSSTTVRGLVKAT